MFLQATFTNKTPFKLLNIYKGLCINTASTIVRKTDQEVYVTYEQLQGTVMQFEKETVMQSSNFSKDIVADVKYIDHKKKLHNLKTLDLYTEVRMQENILVLFHHKELPSLLVMPEVHSMVKY